MRNVHSTPGDEQVLRAKRFRRNKNRQLRAEGHTIPVARVAYRVEVSAVPIPAWAAQYALKTLSVGDQHIWVRRDGVARRLARLDKTWGGIGRIDTYEYRRCGICDRLLLGREAADLREWLRTHTDEPQRPCEANCKR